jgi:hypothetical protein
MASLKRCPSQFTSTPTPDKANERPLRFWLDADMYEISTIEDRWHDPTAEYFKVRTVDGKLFLLRYDEREDEWTLQSGF